MESKIKECPLRSYQQSSGHSTETPKELTSLVAGVGFEPTTFGLWGQSQDARPHSDDFRPIDPRIQPSVKALAQLSPQNQDLAINLIRQLAQREGINVALTPGTLTTPAEGIPLWVTLRISKMPAKTRLKWNVERHTLCSTICA